MIMLSNISEGCVRRNYSVVFLRTIEDDIFDILTVSSTVNSKALFKAIKVASINTTFVC